MGGAPATGAVHTIALSIVFLARDRVLQRRDRRRLCGARQHRLRRRRRDAAALIPAWTLIGLSAGITLLGRDRKNIAWRDTAALLPGCLIGMLLGLYIFKTLDSRTLARGLGVLVLIYGAHALWGTFRGPTKWNVPPRVAAPVAGLLGGAVGTTFGTMASLFFAIYFDVIRMSKDHFRATLSAILVALGVARGIGYFAIDEFNRDVLLTFAFAVPLMLVGIFIGDRFHTGLSELGFRRVVSVALIVSGLALLAK